MGEIFSFETITPFNSRLLPLICIDFRLCPDRSRTKYFSRSRFKKGIIVHSLSCHSDSSHSIRITQRFFLSMRAHTIRAYSHSLSERISLQIYLPCLMGFGSSSVAGRSHFLRAVFRSGHERHRSECVRERGAERERGTFSWSFLDHCAGKFRPRDLSREDRGLTVSV